MRIKQYKVSEGQILNHLYSLSFTEQLAVISTFGEKAKSADMKVKDYIIKLAKEGLFTFKGIPVKLKE